MELFHSKRWGLLKSEMFIPTSILFFIFFHVIYRKHPPNIDRYLYSMDTQNTNKYSYILWTFIGYHKGWEGKLFFVGALLHQKNSCSMQPLLNKLVIFNN